MCRHLFEIVEIKELYCSFLCASGRRLLRISNAIAYVRSPANPDVTVSSSSDLQMRTNFRLVMSNL